MSSLILVKPISGLAEIAKTIAITDDGKKFKAGLLAASSEFTAKNVVDDASRDTAKGYLADIHDHLKKIEADHAEGKAPFKAVCDAFDKAKRDYIPELEAEKKRLGSVIGGYEAEKQRRIDEEQRKLREQAQALELQRQKEATATQAALDKAKKPSQQLAIELERQEQDELFAEQQRSLVDRAAEVEATAGKATGGATRFEWDIKVIDIRALYADHPECVELTEKKSVIKALLNAGIVPKGVSAIKHPSFSARASK